MSRLFFTTSWDDGSVLDLKVAEILNRNGAKGTFYIPRVFDGRGGKYSSYNRRLTEQEIVSISATQEVGSHTLTHRQLTGLSEPELAQEIRGSKQWLEDITKKPVEMFCYPNGKFSEGVKKHVETAGFKGARTTRKLASITQNDHFLFPVSLQIAPFPFRRIDEKKLYWRRLLDPLRSYGRGLLTLPSLWTSLTSWQKFAREFFHYAQSHGNYFHLYGHSWELGRYDMWNELENFLVFVKKHPDVHFVTNGEIAKQL